MDHYHRCQSEFRDFCNSNKEPIRTSRPEAFWPLRQHRERAFRRLLLFTTCTMRNDFQNHRQLVLMMLCNKTIKIRVAIIFTAGARTEMSTQSPEATDFPGSPFNAYLATLPHSTDCRQHGRAKAYGVVPSSSEYPRNVSLEDRLLTFPS